MRKLTVNGVEYRVTTGRSNTKISLHGKGTYAPSNAEVISCSNESYERGLRKGTEDCAVTPARVAYWIRKNSWRFTPLKNEKTLLLRQPDFDEVLDFKGANALDGVVGIQIWVVGGGAGSAMPHRYIVQMTEMEDNPGMSVTNAPEFVATEVLHKFLPKADPDIITWIEHYPPRGNHIHIAETFDFVFMKFDGKRFHLDTKRHPWKRMTEDDFKELGLIQ